MTRNVRSLIVLAIIVCISFSSLGSRPVLASEKTSNKQGVAQVLVGVVTIVRALPVVATGLDALTCRYETTNVRTTSVGNMNYGTTYYNSSRYTYYYTSPGRTFYLSRDTRMDGILNKGLNNAIKSKTGIDVLAGSKYVSSKTYAFNTNRSVRYAYSTARITKYIFDVRRKCGWWSDTLVVGSAWFTAPSSRSAYYQYVY